MCLKIYICSNVSFQFLHSFACRIVCRVKSVKVCCVLALSFRVFSESVRQQGMFNKVLHTVKLVYNGSCLYQKMSALEEKAKSSIIFMGSQQGSYAMGWMGHGLIPCREGDWSIFQNV